MVQKHAIEFVGGPYDGHKELFGASGMPEQLVWVVCEDAFRLIAGQDGRSCGAITSVAFYELVFDDGLSHYQFLGATSFKALADSIAQLACK